MRPRIKCNRCGMNIRFKKDMFDYTKTLVFDINGIHKCKPNGYKPPPPLQFADK